jgi:hypothetical protein
MPPRLSRARLELGRPAKGRACRPIPCPRVANGNVRQPLHAGRASAIAVGNGFQGFESLFGHGPGEDSNHALND